MTWLPLVSSIGTISFGAEIILALIAAAQKIIPSSFFVPETQRWKGGSWLTSWWPPFACNALLLPLQRHAKKLCNNSAAGTMWVRRWPSTRGACKTSSRKPIWCCTRQLQARWEGSPHGWKAPSWNHDELTATRVLFSLKLYHDGYRDFLLSSDLR